MNTKTKDVIEHVNETFGDCEPHTNIALSERFLSVATGTFILCKGITGIFRKPVGALLETAIGGALIYRGATGYCTLKERLSIPKQEVVVVEHHVVES